MVDQYTLFDADLRAFGAQASVCRLLNTFSILSLSILEKNNFSSSFFPAASASHLVGHHASPHVGDHASHLVGHNNMPDKNKKNEKGQVYQKSKGKCTRI